MQSRTTAQWPRRRVQALIGGLVGVIVAGVLAYFWLAHVRQAHVLQPGESFWDCAKTDEHYSKLCPEMVVVPAGKFMMGSPTTEQGRGQDEGPQHEVTIARPFAVSRFLVTFDQWDTCVQSGGCNLADAGKSAWGRDKQPAIQVSWEDAQQYVKWLFKLTGQKYRLLSEAEWEYAARAGSTTAYSFGDDPAMLDDYAWYTKNSEGRTHPVGEKKPNAFGLYDMHGNLRQWIEDCYHESYEGAPKDGSAWIDSADCFLRVIRGGNWGDDPEILRSAFRFSSSEWRSNYVGSRVARTFAP